MFFDNSEFHHMKVLVSILGDGLLTTHMAFMAAWPSHVGKFVSN